MEHRKIALVIDSLYGGGAEKVVLTLRRALEKAGHDAHVIALEAGGHYATGAERKLHYLRSATKHIGGVRAYSLQAREFTKLIRDLTSVDGKKFDLVVANLIHSQHVVARSGVDHAWYCVHASIIAALRQTLRRNVLQYLRQKWQQKVLNDKQVITVSRGLAQELNECAWLSPKSLRTIYNPVDCEQIRRLGAAPGEQLPSEPYLLHVGRASHQKRLDVLFEALRDSATDLPLVMLTNHPEKVMRLAQAHGVASRVRPVAFRQNPYPWMSHARLVVLSSDYEGFPLVLVEALACGTAVVSTDCPHGPAEILTGPLARWLVPVGDHHSLGAKIAEALITEIDAGSAEILAAVNVDEVAKQYAALTCRA